jgi:hypothetical protein
MDFLQTRDDRPLSDYERLCIFQLKSLMTKDDTYTFIKLPHFETLEETVNHADRCRYDWLSSHPDGVYVDVDCFLKIRYMPAEKGKPFFPLDSTGLMDVFLIYCNNCTAFFKNNFNEKLRDDYIQKNVPLEFQKSFYGWPIELIRKIKGWSTIPEGVYEHRYQTMNELYKRRGAMVTTTAKKSIEQAQLDIHAAVFSSMRDIAEICKLCQTQAQRITELEATITTLQSLKITEIKKEGK